MPFLSFLSGLILVFHLFIAIFIALLNRVGPVPGDVHGGSGTRAEEGGSPPGQICLRLLRFPAAFLTRSRR